MADPIGSLAAGEAQPVYVLVGDEPFQLGAWIDAIREKVLGAEGDAWNSDVFECAETSARQVLAAARTLPMLGARRLVVARNVEDLGKEDQDLLAAYLADPCPTTTLVLVAEKLPAGRLATESKRLGFLLRADQLKDRDTGAFVQARAAERGVRFAPGAVKVLVEALGADASAIDDALARLALWVGDPPRPVTSEDVTTCVAPHRQSTVFALVDAISAGDARAAFGALASLRREREPALLILWWLARQVRHLSVARSCRDSGEIAGRLGVKPFLAEKLARQVRGWSEPALRSALGLLARADLDLKGSRIPEGLLLEALVLALARECGAAEGRPSGRSVPSR